MKLDTQGTGISCYRAAEYGDCSIHVPNLFLLNCLFEILPLPISYWNHL